MSIRHSVLPTKGFHTFVFAVLRRLVRTQEILVVVTLPVDSDGVAPVHDSQHVLPVGDGLWHQDFLHEAAVGASETAHTGNVECGALLEETLPVVVKDSYPHFVTCLSLCSPIVVFQGDRVR